MLSTTAQVCQHARDPHTHTHTRYHKGPAASHDEQQQRMSKVISLLTFRKLNL